MERTIKCPGCGEHHNHIEAVRVVQGGEVVTVTKDGAKEEKFNGSLLGRGSQIEIDMHCEVGWHRWTQTIRFHKGEVLMSTKVTGVLGTGAEYPSTLWRD